MVVVSYGTEDGRYDGYLERLGQSCDAYGLTHELRVIPRATKIKACLRKPGFIREMLDKHHDVVAWIDADAVVTQTFSVPSTGWDIGLLPKPWWQQWRSKNPVHAFVVAVSPTEAARSFLDAWIYLCKWEALATRTDHGRLTWAREMRIGSYWEMNLSRFLRGRLYVTSSAENRKPFSETLSNEC